MAGDKNGDVALTSEVTRIMDFSLVPPFGWGLLVVSIVLAVVLEGGLVQIGLEVARPVSKYVFWVVRFAKMAAVLAWFAFFNAYWFPNYLGDDRPFPQWISMVEWGVILAMAVLAVVTLPKTKPA